jgi:hypothetical protein
MTSTVKIYIGLACLLITFGLGLGAGWKMFRPVVPPPEKPAPAIIQVDGSTVLERKVNPQATPMVMIPKGDTVLRQGVITLSVPSDAVTAQTSGSVQPSVAHPPTVHQVTPEKIDWAFVKEPDQGDRLIVKDENGRVIGGEDVVVREPAESPKELKWGLSLTHHFAQNTWDLRLDRDWKFLRFGAAANQFRSVTTGTLSYDLALSAGVRW